MKNVGGQRAYPDLTLALTPTVRTPQCGHSFGKNLPPSREKESRPIPNMTLPILSLPSLAPTLGALTCHPSIPGGLNVASEDAEDSAARCSVRAGAKVLLPVVKVGAVRQSLQL